MATVDIKQTNPETVSRVLPAVQCRASGVRVAHHHVQADVAQLLVDVQVLLETLLAGEVVAAHDGWGRVAAAARICTSPSAKYTHEHA